MPAKVVVPVADKLKLVEGQPTLDDMAAVPASGVPEQPAAATPTKVNVPGHGLGGEG